MEENNFILPPVPDVLLHSLEERRELINDYYKRMESLLPCFPRYVEELQYAREKGLNSSVVSNLTYNLILKIKKATEDLNTYDYLRSRYLLDDEYDKAYDIWKEFSDCSNRIIQLTYRFEDSYFEEEFDERDFISDFIPMNLNNISDLKSFNIDENNTSMERIDIDWREIIVYLVMASSLGTGFFKCLRQTLRNTEGWLEDLKNGLYLDYEDPDWTDKYDYTYEINYNLYKKDYWNHDGFNFRESIRALNFNRPITIDFLEEQRRDEMRQFVTNPVGQLWRDFSHNKEDFYIEAKRIKINEEQWKYYFKTLCRFEEYQLWIDELSTPPIEVAASDVFVNVKDTAQIDVSQKIAAFFIDGTLKADEPSLLYFLLLAMWARHLLQNKEIPSFVRMLGEAYPALFNETGMQDKIITSLQNMNKKTNYYFDEYVKDQATMKEFIDLMYPKKKNGKRRKVGQNAVDLANKLFLRL